GNAAAGIRFAGARANTIGGGVPGQGNLISANGLGLDMPFAGIVFASGQGGQATDGNLIQGNFIGTVISGTQRLGNGATGITFFSAVANRIFDNVISANGTFVVGFGTDFPGFAPSGNVLQGNKVGTDVTGTQPLGNASFGI